LIEAPERRVKKSKIILILSKVLDNLLIAALLLAFIGQKNLYCIYNGSLAANQPETPKNIIQNKT